MRIAAGVTYVNRDPPRSTSVTSGAQTGNIKYYPYGATRSGAVSTAYKFTGQRLDDSTGLYYYGARYYDAAIGRFVQADTVVQADAKSAQPVLPLVVSYANPRVLEQWNQLQRARLQPEAQAPGTPSAFDPQFLNRYTYARNNPLAYVDDSGNIAWWIIGGVIGGVAGFGAYALTHRDNFSWGEAALWTAGGAVVGATFGAGAQLVAGALGTQAAATAATAATTASPWALPAL
ncbi:MAG: RHS repeat-associated core domain-containing protein, partial [Chloroflexi bacterium]|nr:RHS repeat-associated core domain-containing protein [Chloroflexota bacterium]